MAGSRVEAGFDSPEAIAPLVHRSPRMVRYYEDGEYVPREEFLRVWAEVVNKPLEHFTVAPVAEDGPAPELPPPPPQQHPGIDAMIALLQAPPKANAKLLAELEALRGAKLDRPVMLPGEALDWALLRLRPPPE